NGNWSNYADLVNAGIDGIEAGRGTEPMPEIMIHIDRGGNQVTTEWFFDNLLAQGVEFDVIGQSFYLEWHGTFTDLTNCLNFTAQNYSQDIVIAETADYYTGESGASPENQKAFLEELIRRIEATPNGKGRGLFYWEPAWVWNSPNGYRALFAPINDVWDNVDMLMAMEAFDIPIPPSAPTSLAATAGDGTVSLDWDDNSESDLAGYNIYRSINGAGATRLNSSLLTVSEYLDDTVTNFTVYSYVVTAIDTDDNESSYSKAKSAVPNDGSLVLLSNEDFVDDTSDWANVTGDSHNWTRTSGQTPTGETYGTTGPDGSAGESTGYLFFETSRASDGAGEPGDTAWFESPEINGTDRILIFYYHMYGAHIGTLYVDVYDGIWTNGIWSISGQQQTSPSDPYSPAVVDLSDFSRPIRIRFRAVAAGGHLGDMAIDDIEVYGIEDTVIDIPDYYSTGQVSVNTVYQEIEGFGASGAWYDNWLTGHPRKDEIYGLLFGQLGLDIYRLRNVYDQGNDVYMSRSAEIITAGEESLGRSLKIMISCWSPPTYLKSNDNLNRGTLKKDANGDYMYHELAEWWADSLDVWSGIYGVNADYINVQNEPDWEADWDTCRYSGTETKKIAGYDQAFESVWQVLNSRMGSGMPTMLAAEAAGIPNSAGYLENLIDDSHAYGYSHHLYNINSGDDPDVYIPYMSDFATDFGDRPIFQTEYEASTDSWPDALNLARLIHNSLTVEGVAGYLYWQLFWGGSGGLVTIPSEGSSEYIINSDYYGFKHYSAFIHSGWQRVEALTNATDLLISAYISPDEDELSVVIINAGADVYENEFTFAGFIVISGNMYRTSQTRNCALVESYDPASPLILPAGSITTLDLSIALESETCYADAGPDQTVYAFIDGYADVTLDGSCSTDPNNTHTYSWNWTIDDVDCQATGQTPHIQLPIGDHTIDLLLKNGPYASESDDCSVEVVGPMTMKLKYKPSSLNTKVLAKYSSVTATIKTPKGIGADDIDEVESLIFYPGGIEAENLTIVEKGSGVKVKATITATFDITDCMEQLEANEKGRVHVVGKFTTGQYFDAVGTMKYKP
ncbi:MAG: glycosyl hydrolase 53 family protein, partial [Sedimentisphaerales bacterium]|nr:glycosyl hydrolase 53 family protein [Sedimentisphaerales bacterium]